MEKSRVSLQSTQRKSNPVVHVGIGSGHCACLKKCQVPKSLPMLWLTVLLSVQLEMRDNGRQHSACLRKCQVPKSLPMLWLTPRSSVHVRRTDNGRQHCACLRKCQVPKSLPMLWLTVLLSVRLEMRDNGRQHCACLRKCQVPKSPPMLWPTARSSVHVRRTDNGRQHCACLRKCQLPKLLPMLWLTARSSVHVRRRDNGRQHCACLRKCQVPKSLPMLWLTRRSSVHVRRRDNGRQHCACLRKCPKQSLVSAMLHTMPYWTVRRYATQNLADIFLGLAICRCSLARQYSEKSRLICMLFLKEYVEEVSPKVFINPESRINFLNCFKLVGGLLQTSSNGQNIHASAILGLVRSSWACSALVAVHHCDNVGHPLREAVDVYHHHRIRQVQRSRATRRCLDALSALAPLLGLSAWMLENLGVSSTFGSGSCLFSELFFVVYWLLYIVFLIPPFSLLFCFSFFLFLCFSAFTSTLLWYFLLLCFSAFLLLCFSVVFASLLFCFFVSLLCCFSALCFVCFSASLLLCFPLWFVVSIFFVCFCAFAAFCFSTKWLVLLLDYKCNHSYIENRTSSTIRAAKAKGTPRTTNATTRRTTRATKQPQRQSRNTTRKEVVSVFLGRRRCALPSCSLQLCPVYCFVLSFLTLNFFALV